MTDELEIIRTRHEEAEKIYAPIGKRAASHTDRATLLRALNEAQERVRRLEEALKFYADPNRWPNMPNPKNPHYDLEMDAGSRARFALHARAALNQEPGQ